MALWGQLILKRFAPILLCLAMLPTAMADDGLPILQRSLLPDEQLWQLETELTGHRERTGAGHECPAAALSGRLPQVLDIFRNSPYGLTVHRLVR